MSKLKPNRTSEPVTLSAAVGLSEAAFLEQILALAKVYDWRTAHFRPARTTNGWRTPCQGDAKGFPDLVLVKGKRLIFAELKSEGNGMTAAQEDWWWALHEAGQQFFCWQPTDWDEIVRVLSAEVYE